MVKNGMWIGYTKCYARDTEIPDYTCSHAHHPEHPLWWSRWFLKDHTQVQGHAGTGKCGCYSHAVTMITLGCSTQNKKFVFSPQGVLKTLSNMRVKFLPTHNFRLVSWMISKQDFKQNMVCWCFCYDCLFHIFQRIKKVKSLLISTQKSCLTKSAFWKAPHLTTSQSSVFNSWEDFLPRITHVSLARESPRGSLYVDCNVLIRLEESALS